MGPNTKSEDDYILQAHTPKVNLELHVFACFWKKPWEEKGGHGEIPSAQKKYSIEKVLR